MAGQSGRCGELLQRAGQGGRKHSRDRAGRRPSGTSRLSSTPRTRSARCAPPMPDSICPTKHSRSASSGRQRRARHCCGSSRIERAGLKARFRRRPPRARPSRPRARCCCAIRRSIWSTGATRLNSRGEPFDLERLARTCMPIILPHAVLDRLHGERRRRAAIQLLARARHSRHHAEQAREHGRAGLLPAAASGEPVGRCALSVRDDGRCRVADHSDVARSRPDRRRDLSRSKASFGHAVVSVQQLRRLAHRSPSSSRKRESLGTRSRIRATICRAWTSRARS